MSQDMPVHTPRIQSHIENAGLRYIVAREKMAEHGLLVRHLRPQLVEPVSMVLERTELEGFEVGASELHVLETEEYVTLHNGGVTLVYRQRREDSFIEVASAICSLKDTFCRKVGTALAVESFLNGYTMRLPNYARVSPTELIDHVFGHMLVADSRRLRH